MSYVEDFNQCYEAIKDDLSSLDEISDSVTPFMNKIGARMSEKLVRSMYREQCGRVFENANEAYVLLKPMVMDRISPKAMEWIFFGLEVGKNVDAKVLVAGEKNQWEELCDDMEFQEHIRLNVQRLSAMDTMMLQNRVNAVLSGRIEEMREGLSLMFLTPEATHKIWDLFQMFYEMAALVSFATGVKMGEKSLVNDEFESLMDNLINGSGKLADPTEEE